MRHIKFIMFASIMLALGLAAGCAPKVTRIEINKPVDLSGRWNDTDSRIVAEDMIKDCLDRPWLSQFNMKKGREPVVIVGPVMNKTSEHIDSDVFIKELERTLLNSSKVKFVASRDERISVRDEREDQQAGDTSPETITPKGRETGADFMLQGSVHAIKDEIRGKYVVLYRVNLELINLTNNEKTWIGQKELKKVVARPEYSY